MTRRTDAGLRLLFFIRLPISLGAFIQSEITANCNHFLRPFRGRFGEWIWQLKRRAKIADAARLAELFRAPLQYPSHRVFPIRAAHCLKWRFASLAGQFEQRLFFAGNLEQAHALPRFNSASLRPIESMTREENAAGRSPRFGWKNISAESG